MNDETPVKVVVVDPTMQTATELMRSKKPVVSAIGTILALVYLFLLGGLVVASIKLVVAMESCK